MRDTFDLTISHVSKAYPGVVALDDVSFSVTRGEVVGLIGENGAGKSTLMKVLGGIVAPTSGQISIDGVSHDRLTVPQSHAQGIAFVHQELNPFDNLDVKANVLLGREIRRGRLGLIDSRAMADAVRPVLARLDASFGPDDPVAGLSLAERQVLEIARALSMQARLVIMDEPTSSLSMSETARLLSVIADLKASGVAVLFISHRLSEVGACADRVVALRDGRISGFLDKPDITPPAMIGLMIGRSLVATAARAPRGNADDGAVLDLRALRTTAYPSAQVSLTVHAGEVLGLAGLIGAGRSELARAVFGIDPVLGGTVHLHGADTTGTRPAGMIAAGLCLVPEDRKAEGLILDFPIAQNIALPSLSDMARHGLVDLAAEQARADAQCAELSVRTPDVIRAAADLSGGNQQKVVLGKWLSRDPRMIILDEPTRGVDVGSKAEIYALIRRLTERGVAVLMISSDMEEVLAVSDRIAVMRHGQVSGMLGRADFSEYNVLSLAVG